MVRGVTTLMPRFRRICNYTERLATRCQIPRTLRSVFVSVRNYTTGLRGVCGGLLLDGSHPPSSGLGVLVQVTDELPSLADLPLSALEGEGETDRFGGESPLGG